MTRAMVMWVIRFKGECIPNGSRRIVVGTMSSPDNAHSLDSAPSFVLKIDVELVLITYVSEKAHLNALWNGAEDCL